MSGDLEFVREDLKQSKTPAGPLDEEKLLSPSGNSCRCTRHSGHKARPPRHLQPAYPGERRVAPIILCERCVANFIMLPIQWFDGAGSRDSRLAVWPKQGTRGDEVTREGKKQDEGDVMRGRRGVGGKGRAQMRACDVEIKGRIKAQAAARTQAHMHASTQAHVHKFHFFFLVFSHS